MNKRQEYYKKHRLEEMEYARGWQKKHRHPCLDCGTLCSVDAQRCYSCASKNRWKTGQMASLMLKGEANPNWRGGRFKDARGYVYLKKPEYLGASKTGYIAEHKFIWEQAHGKPLPKGWIIHHLNGIPDDNRIVNLVGLPNKKHAHILQAKAKRIQELEAILNNQHQLL